MFNYEPVLPVWAFRNCTEPVGQNCSLYKEAKNIRCPLLATMFISIFQESASALTNLPGEKEKACQLVPRNGVSFWLVSKGYKQHYLYTMDNSSSTGSLSEQHWGLQVTTCISDTLLKFLVIQNQESSIFYIWEQ